MGGLEKEIILSTKHPNTIRYAYIIQICNYLKLIKINPFKNKKKNLQINFTITIITTVTDKQVSI